ncbi:Mu transposase C-terminal domain-containing protein [Psychrobacter sp. Marseille-P5312]|uniref:Mu transposase C-terminal domain-containing protein n=1 Tax=Psychrobacter sp. Marseille-P5312 TaxID=2086574 RepID=UPI00131A07E9|nr:Mu transposase C-terminal domain-containing protein [Psychrobacter sp. Marseille-P5312]
MSSHFDTSSKYRRDHIQMVLGGIYRNKTDDEYQLIEYLDDLNQAVFKNLKTLSNHVLSIHDFDNVIDGANTSVVIDLNDIGDDEWQEAQKKYLAITPLIMEEDWYGEDNYRGEQGYERRAKEVGVSSRTLRRWVDAYQSTGSIGSLIDQKRGWKKGTKRLNEETENLINEVINNFYLTVQRPNVQATIREIHRRCYVEDIEKPSKNTIRNRIKEIKEKDLLRGRGQRKRAKQKFTAKAGHFPDAKYPLSVIQIDHTPVDLILVDDKHRRPIGRPFITVAIDVYSRMVTGYYISLDAPSVTSVSMCISRSILPKDELLLEFGLSDVKWNVFGIPKKIHVDNGSDFRAESLQKSCAFHGINLEFRPLARPEYGGHIERFIGTIMKRVHELPGTTFSNIKEKDEYNSEKHASLTLHEFEKWFLTYITMDYHESIHSGIKRSPKEQWRIGIFGEGFESGIGLPPIPSDRHTLVLDFMPSALRTIQRNGTTIGGLQYYDACLNNFINHTDDNGNKTKFIFRQDPRDITRIWFYDPELLQYFPVPLANQVLPPISLWEYRKVYKQVKQDSGIVNEALIYQALQDIHTLVEESQNTTKKVLRSEQRKKSHTKSQTMYGKLKSDESEEVDILDTLPESTRVLNKKAVETSLDGSNDNDDDLYFEDID